MQVVVNFSKLEQVKVGNIAHKAGMQLIPHIRNANDRSLLLIQLSCNDDVAYLSGNNLEDKQHVIIWVHNSKILKKTWKSLEDCRQKWIFIVHDFKIRDFLVRHMIPYNHIFVCIWPVNDYRWVAQSPSNYSTQVYNNISYSLWSTHQRGGLVNISNTGNNDVLKYFSCMASGVPVVYEEGDTLSSIIKRTHTGIFSNSNTINKLTEEQYTTMSNNAIKVAQTMISNIEPQNTLLKAMKCSALQCDYRELNPKFGIHVFSTSDTLDYIFRNKCSVARLGDGEISLINGAEQVFQNADPELRKRLDQIAKTNSNKKLLVCLDDVFHGINYLTDRAQSWWSGHLNTFKEYYSELGKLGNIYGNTMVTRPYIDYKDKSKSIETFTRIKDWWYDRDILIVEGKYTRSGVGNDLFEKARSVERIICPSKNAWSKYIEIEEAIKQYGQGKLVLVMLGMTATVIAADLASWGQVIDLGHLDPEYEWYKMGVNTRVAIQGKHTAEMNYDQGVPQNIDDQQYLGEIVKDLS